MAKHLIFVDGAAGTTGLRIHQRLAQQADIELLSLPESQRKDVDSRLAAIQKADLTILCLPDDAARHIAALAPSGARICDASTAHRTNPAWVYGMPELHGRRQAVQSANRVSVPGCHATGFVALAAPLLQSGALPPDARLSCHSLTGYSGGGKQMIAAYEDASRPEVYAAPRAYALAMSHKHLPEMCAISGLLHPPAFCPIVADYPAGMLLSIPLPANLLAAPWRSPQALAALYAEYYASQPLITVHPAADAPPDGTLCANALAGRDTLEIFTFGSDDNLLLAARFDNLGKGASGAAVQCANLMLGRPETAGLVL